MVSAMSPIVSVVQAEPRPIAVIAATTSWSEFPSLWGQLLGEVWTFLRAHDQLLRGGGSSVMLYRDDTPNVEVGVVVAGPFAPSGRIVASQLPGARPHTPCTAGRTQTSAARMTRLSRGARPTIGPHPGSVGKSTETTTTTQAS